MGETDNKIEIIKKIQEHHPGQDPGQKRGWSWYTGGMADTGGWHTMKMLDANIADLEACLKELEDIKNAPPKVYTPEELAMINTPTVHHLSCGGVVHSNAYEDMLWQNHAANLEKQLLWGAQS